MTKLGIDVSDAQKSTIDFTTAKNNNLAFVMVRCGYGQNQTSQDDSNFETYVAKCESLGIPWGAYLYSYTMTESAVQGEISHALRLLSGKTPKLGVFIDMEDADGYKAKNGGIPSKSVNTSIAKTFCKAMVNAGYKAGYYCNKDWYTNYLTPTELTDYLFWYSRPGVSAVDIDCDLWQTAFGESGGSFTGIGNCDTDTLITESLINTIPTTGWYQDSSTKNWYYYKDGSLVKNGWVQWKEQWYAFDTSGVMIANGWAKDSSNRWFYLGSNGAMVTNGWAQDSHGWCYLDKDGAWDGIYHEIKA